MKYFFLIATIFCLSQSAICQKSKVKYKKGTILVDGEKFCTYEDIVFGSKVSYKLDGVEFLYLNYQSVPTGNYTSDGKVIRKTFIVLSFTSTDLEKFEVDLMRKEIIRQMIAMKVVENGKFNPDNAVLFKDKFEEEISKKYIKTIEININN